MLQSPISPHKTPNSPDNKGWTYTQPNTGNIFRSLSLDALIGQVESHRFSLAGKGLEMDLAHQWQSRFLDELCGQNPSAACGPNQLSPDFEPPHVAIGRERWAELHAKAEEDNDPYALRTWFEKWLEKVPDYAGCKCRSNAIQLLASMPPDFSKEGFKPWTIRFHNEINRRLGKRQWPYD